MWPKHTCIWTESCSSAETGGAAEERVPSRCEERGDSASVRRHKRHRLFHSKPRPHAGSGSLRREQDGSGDVEGRAYGVSRRRRTGGEVAAASGSWRGGGRDDG
jgi:hypothetical protein